MATETSMTAATVLTDQNANQPQIKVNFTTRDADLEIQGSPGPILVPTNLRRYGLSTLVNHLLGTTKPTPFNFLVSGSFLRSSIDEYLTANGLSSETTLNLEYLLALPPPQYQASFLHDDWVSSVDVLSGTTPVRQQVSNGPQILSASYDGLLRIWDGNTQEEIATSAPQDVAGPSAIKAARYLSPTSIASASLDQRVRLWKYDSSKKGAQLQPSLELVGHRSSVDALAVNIPTNRILTGSADSSICLWSTKKSENPAAPSNLANIQPNKRRKTALLGQSAVAQRGALSGLTGHSAPVSAVAFAPGHNGTVAYSSSWDHTLRTWDLETAQSVDNRSTSSSLLSLVPMPEVNAVATGSSARHIALIDPRVSAKTVAAMTLRGHRGAVVSLASQPAGHGAGYGLVSGSHDGTCRVWDLRSRKSAGVASAESTGAIGESMYTLERNSLVGSKGRTRPTAGDGVKVFSVVWDKEVGIVSAGEDKRVQIDKGLGAEGTS